MDLRTLDMRNWCALYLDCKRRESYRSSGKKYIVRAFMMINPDKVFQVFRVHPVKVRTHERGGSRPMRTHFVHFMRGGGS